MDEIAASAGVGKGTVYLYYPSKEELLVASVTNRLKEYRREVLAPMDGASDGELTRDRVREVLSAALERMVGFVSDESTRPVMRLLFSERRRFPELADGHAKWARRIQGKLTGFLRKAERAGVIRCESPQAAAKALIGLAMSAALSEELGPDKTKRSRLRSARRTVVDFALRGLGLDEMGSD